MKTLNTDLPIIPHTSMFLIRYISMTPTFLHINEICICITHKIFLCCLKRLHQTEAHWRGHVLYYRISVTTHFLCECCFGSQWPNNTLHAYNIKFGLIYLSYDYVILYELTDELRTLTLCSTKGDAFTLFADSAYVIMFIKKRGHNKHPTPLNRDCQNTLSRNKQTHFSRPYNII
jgi:hypothetical protein